MSQNVGIGSEIWKGESKFKTIEKIELVFFNNYLQSQNV